MALRQIRSLLPVALRALSAARCRSSVATTTTVPTTTTTLPQQRLQDAAHEEDEDAVKVFEKNPDLHGFSEDPTVDLWNMRLAFFFGLSVCIVLGSVFVHYLPDRG
ncbi:NADH dehydrogenase [ubiquinone] 1 beta subcomplex subunit 11, mitochondrial-like [Rhinatrema bivittatum]|uniref:NADH dehydrogenase [ubiquinone] 1 beta subcomplex subunit 11, mitochondrial-like n=1 Tax=Rhinatrema bivittatum TaxID=194408 RepID=UPI00112865BA|nr:NADH dehydrogenase [ubiquinone] 1 beta subcomplex subunit 11, mitochondrial-like [Rhinatrema bivittatum]